MSATEFIFKTAIGIGFAVVVAMAALWAVQDKFLFLPIADRAVPAFDNIAEASVSTADGETIIIWYAPAADGCPTLMQFHGNGGHLATEKWRHQRILPTGVGLLAVSWRGYAGSTGKPSEYGFHLDARAAWDWLIAQGIDRNDIVIQAHSIGTGAAVQLAADVQPGALILEAPFYSMKDLVARKLPFLPTGLILRHPFRSDQHIANVNSPVLVLHGTKDSVIPLEQGQRLYDLAREPKHFVPMNGSDHNTLVRDGLFDHVWPFLTKFWRPSSGDACPFLSSLQEPTQ